MRYCFITILFGITLLTSCINVRQISKGNLPENKTFNFYFYNHTSVNNKQNKLFKTCKIYFTHIKDSEKKIEENIVWYSCDSLLPIKYFLATDSTTGIEELQSMIADTSTNFLVPINQYEKEVFEITNKYLSSLGYKTYDVKGFKLLSNEISTTGFPFLNSTLKFYKK